MTLCQHCRQVCGLGLDVLVSKRIFETSQSQGKIGRARSSCLGLKARNLRLRH